MSAEELFRREMFNRLRPKLQTVSEPVLAVPASMEALFTRRSILKAGMAALGLAAVGSTFNPAEVQAGILRVQNTLELAQQSFGRYNIVPKSYEKAGGRQSKLWLPARYNLTGYLGSIDQADLNQHGPEYAYINGVSHGPHGAFIQRLSQTEAQNNRDFNFDWTGWCKAAAIASYNGPILTEGSSAFGVEASLDDLMIMDTLYHAYSKVLARWDNLTEQTYAQAVQAQTEARAQGKDPCLVGNTSRARGYPNQQWWGLVWDINPVSKERTLIDFLEWKKFAETRGQVIQNTLPVAPQHTVPIELIDPSEPEIGLEAYYNYILFHREIVQVFLGMADAIPKS